MDGELIRCDRAGGLQDHWGRGLGIGGRVNNVSHATHAGRMNHCRCQPSATPHAHAVALRDSCNNPPACRT